VEPSPAGVFLHTHLLKERNDLGLGYYARAYELRAHENRTPPPADGAMLGRPARVGHSAAEPNAARLHDDKAARESHRRASRFDRTTTIPSWVPSGYSRGFEKSRSAVTIARPERTAPANTSASDRPRNSASMTWVAATRTPPPPRPGSCRRRVSRRSSRRARGFLESLVALRRSGPTFPAVPRGGGIERPDVRRGWSRAMMPGADPACVLAPIGRSMC
jgi:hypothetical protein